MVCIQLPPFASAGLDGPKYAVVEPSECATAALSGTSDFAHSDLKLTLRYAHLSPAHLLAAVGALDGLTEAAPAAPDLAHEMAHNPFSGRRGLLSDRMSAILFTRPP
jgi:hypothetical protein